jgi:tRNA-dihydrouridine synthase B
MAQAARFNVERGAQIIDINMGCPAKKVCNAMAGSALLRNEDLVARILRAVVAAVDVPVTLKIRTGWDPQHRNALTIASIAEQAGITALAIHGRTRACGYRGDAEYETIRQVKQAVSIPVIANGDVTGPKVAKDVLEHTGADAVMIGRAAHGRPWIFRETEHYLSTGELLPEPGSEEIRTIMIEHLNNLYTFYGEYTGVRVARKHIAWYSKGFRDGAGFRRRINQVESVDEQLAVTHRFFDGLADSRGMAA